MSRKLYYFLSLLQYILCIMNLEIQIDPYTILQILHIKHYKICGILVYQYTWSIIFLKFVKQREQKIS